MARMVAGKAALSIRIDALADADSKSALEAGKIGFSSREKLHSHLRRMEHQLGLPVSQFKADRREQSRFEMQANGAGGYNAGGDVVAIKAGADGEDVDMDAEERAVEVVKEVKEEQEADKKDKKKKKKRWVSLVWDWC